MKTDLLGTPGQPWIQKPFVEHQSPAIAAAVATTSPATTPRGIGVARGSSAAYLGGVKAPTKPFDPGTIHVILLVTNPERKTRFSFTTTTRYCTTKER